MKLSKWSPTRKQTQRHQEHVAGRWCQEEPQGVSPALLSLWELSGCISQPLITVLFHSVCCLLSSFSVRLSALHACVDFLCSLSVPKYYSTFFYSNIFLPFSPQPDKCDKHSRAVCKRAWPESDPCSLLFSCETLSKHLDLVSCNLSANSNKLSFTPVSWRLQGLMPVRSLAPAWLTVRTLG